MAQSNYLTKAQVRKQLSLMSKKELEDIVLILYDCGAEPKARINTIIQGSSYADKLYNEYLVKIQRLLKGDEGDAENRQRIAQAKRDIVEFKKMTGDEEKTMLLYTVCATSAMEIYNGLWHFNNSVFNTIRPVIKKITAYAAKHKPFYEEIKDRLHTIQEIIQQYMFLWFEVEEYYEKIPWYFEDFPEEEDSDEENSEESKSAETE